jgi:3-hydroxyisobutyrate dehydrogenase-like beta-hydroxyacid dehydrogenase
VLHQVLCENLARYGPKSTRVSAWNRTRSAGEELAAQVENIEAVSSLADAVNNSDIICVCLSDDAAVKEVFSEIVSKASAAVSGKLFVDLSTIHPDTASAEAERLHKLGAEYLGSPSKFRYPPR